VDYKLDFLFVWLSEMDHRPVPTSVIIFKMSINISSSLRTQLEIKFNNVSLNIPSMYCLLFCRNITSNVVISNPAQTDINRTFIPTRTAGFANVV
jgi:hypothetical protein